MSEAESTLVAVHFQVLAEASPGLLSRLLEPLAKRDLTPDQVHASRQGELMRTDLTLHAMPAEMVHLVAGNMGQVIGVMDVRVLRDEAVKLAA